MGKVRERKNKNLVFITHFSYIQNIDHNFILNDNNLEEIIYLIPELKKTNLIIND